LSSLSLFLTAYRVAHIHHSGLRRKQANSAAKLRKRVGNNIDAVSIGSLMAEGASAYLSAAGANQGAALLGLGAAARRFPAWLIGHALDHHHEQYPAFIPTAQPAHSPALQVIANFDRPTQSQEFGFNMHSPLGHAWLCRRRKSTRHSGLAC
jgi:hypothetical protein